MNESADFVMYWWDRAADLLTRKGTRLRRFGLVTTNSISQVFQRRVMERYLSAKSPLSLIFAIPDHPWTKAARDAAAVRIAMTVAEAGSREGVVSEVMAEDALDTDTPILSFRTSTGRINSDLTVGVDVTKAVPLLANEGLCSPGVKLHGAGFIVTPAEAAHLGLGRRPGLERHIRPYRNGRDLTSHARGVMVIDLFGLREDEVRRSFPEVYQHLLATVKPERETNNRASYKRNWWIFGEPRSDLRPALDGLDRYIVTVETTKHRVFQFMDVSILPDNMLVAVASESATVMVLLSSHPYALWTSNTGGVLEDRPRYTKSVCFDPFPFPDLSSPAAAGLNEAGEELDDHRKRVLAEHPDLTLTGLYNVLEKLKTGAPLTPKDEDVKDRGLVLVLRELHAEIDQLTAEAYGWPADLDDTEILARLVALNAERAKEEAAGHVRWLRPDYQMPRFGRQATVTTGELNLGETVVAIDAALPPFPTDPLEAPLAVEKILAGAAGSLSALEIARRFRRSGKRVEQKVAKALTTLVRYGRVFPDGEKFIVRRNQAA